MRKTIKVDVQKKAFDIIDSCKTEEDISRASNFIDIYLNKTQDIDGYEQLRKAIIEKSSEILNQQ